MPGRARRERVARGERLRDRLVVRVAVVDAEGRERVEERPLGVASGTRSCGRRGPASDGSTDERSSSTTCEYVAGSSGSCQSAFSLQYASTSAIRSAERPVSRRYRSVSSSTGKKPHVAPYSGDMFPIVARSASGSVCSPCPKYSTNFPTTPVSRRICVTVRTRSVAVAPSGQRAGQPEAHDLRHEHRDRLAEHRGLRLDAADAPAEHAEPVDHRRVRVRADERVRERDAVALVDDAREELEVHLVDDPGARRDDLEVVEGALAPAQERVALAVALELELGVPEDRASRRELVDLHRVVDHELDGEERVDLLGSPPRSRIALRIAARSTTAGTPVKSWRSTRPGVKEISCEGSARRDPARDRLDVLGGDVDAVLRAQDVLEQDAQRVGEPEDVVARLQRLEAEDLVARAADVERRPRAEAVRVGHASIQADLSRRPCDTVSLASSSRDRVP